MGELRETQTILFGDTGFIIEQNTFVMSRIRKGNPGYLLISNLGDNEASLDISGTKDEENNEPKIKNMAKRGTLDLAIPTTNNDQRQTTTNDKQRPMTNNDKQRP